MATLRHILIYLKKHSQFKVRRTLTIRGSAGVLHKRRARHWRLIPTRPVPPDVLYPKKCIHGGHIIPILLRDGRDGHLDQIVLLEMKWIDGYGWYPCSYRLTMREAAAVCGGIALSSFYRISDDLESRRKIFNKVFFITHTLFEADINRVDELARRIEKKKGGRPGAHAEYCDGGVKHRGRCPHAQHCIADHKHAGTCDDPRRRRRRPSPSRGWSKGPRLQHDDDTHSTRHGTSLPNPTTDADASAPRQAWTVALIHEMTSDSAERAAMYKELQADIESEQRAGHLVPKGEEIV